VLPIHLFISTHFLGDLIVPLFPKPHSPEWFAALEAFNPQQAAHTQQIVKLAGSSDVCSVCGDDPASAYKLTAPNMPAKAVGTIKLCADCLKLRSAAGESFAPF
jgi:hypothetical protein